MVLATTETTGTTEEDQSDTGQTSTLTIHHIVQLGSVRFLITHVFKEPWDPGAPWSPWFNGENTSR